MGGALRRLLRRARPATSSRPRPNPGDMGVNMKQELMLFIFELNKQGLITLPKEDADAVKQHHKDHMGINSPVHRHIRGRENWPEPQDTFWCPSSRRWSASRWAASRAARRRR